jgi:hypothetical protein
MATKILKMRSGEELIASVKTNFTGDKESSYNLKNPCMLVPVPNKSGSYDGNLAILPWMSSVKQDKGITVPCDAVLFMADPIVELENQYSTAFGSGIVMPTNDIGVPNLRLS